MNSPRTGGVGPSHGEEAYLAGERLRLILHGVADVARNRSRAHDPEGPGEMGSEGGRDSGRQLYRRVIRHRRVTLHSVRRIQRLSDRSTNFRNETEFRVHVPILDKADLLGSRLCFLKRSKAALIFYRKDSRPVSLFELSGSDVSLWALDRTVIDGSPIWHKSFSGYSLVAFENRGVVNVL